MILFQNRVKHCWDALMLLTVMVILQLTNCYVVNLHIITNYVLRYSAETIPATLSLYGSVIWCPNQIKYFWDTLILQHSYM